MSGGSKKDHRLCWKCKSRHPPDAKVCTRCGIYLDTGEPLVPPPEPAPFDEATSDRLFYWRVTPGRIASAIVWLGYVALAVWMSAAGGDARSFQLPVYMIFPVVLIWFADSFAGMSVVRAGGVMRFPKVPALVAFCGWALLVGWPVPLLVGALISWCGM